MPSHRRLTRTPLLTALVAALATFGLAATAMAQSTTTTQDQTVTVTRPTQLTVTTDYPSMTVDPGSEADFPLTVAAPVDERVNLSIDGVPDGFNASFRGGKAIVSSVYTAATPPALDLRVSVPSDASPGQETLTITATSATGQATLPVDIKVGTLDAGSVSLESKYPVLSGDSSTTYSFDLTLYNNSSKDITFGLQGTGPDGWTVDVAPAGSAKASTALVTAGSRTAIKVTADPPKGVPAGRYLLEATADGDGLTASSQLGVEITGTHALTLGTSDGRLNDSVAAGGSDTMSLVVTNTGTAPLSDVKLSARTPKGWNVTFTPDTIPDLQPSAVSQVDAKVEPAGNSVAGDYVVTMTATSANVSDNVQIRSTVETSALWGVAAVGVIAVALGGLMLVFRRYGRR